MWPLSLYTFLDLVKKCHIVDQIEDFSFTSAFSRLSACTVALQRYQLLSLPQLLLFMDVFMDECVGSFQIWVI